jgi:hypothetical protein
VKTQKHPQVNINFEVVEDILEKAQIKAFKPEKNIFLKPPINLMLEVENIGNREIAPEGRILIYNRRGEEVDEIRIDKNSIEAGKTISLNKEWNNGNMGKYKAKIMLDYGTVVKRDLNDSLFFWIFPDKWLLSVFGTTIFLVSLLVFIIFRRTYKPVHNIGVPEPSEKEVVVLNLKKRKKKNENIKKKKSKQVK